MTAISFTIFITSCSYAPPTVTPTTYPTPSATATATPTHAPTIFDLVEIKADQYGLPKGIWYPIVMTESGGDHRLIYTTKYENSYGLFQVNIKAHPEADPDKLLTVNYNCDWQMPVLKYYYDKGRDKGLEGLELLMYTAKKGQAPEWSKYYRESLTKYYYELN